jgi:hypothetical protein
MLVYRSPSTWELYRWHIIGALVVIGGQSVLIAGLLLQHRRRRRAEAALQDRLSFETLVSDLSAALVTLRSAEVNVGVEAGLRRVGEHLHLDRAMILEFSPNSEAIDAIRVWTARGVTDPQSAVQLSEFPWSVGQLRQGRVVRFSRLDDLRRTLPSIGPPTRG